ncbi:unnamed protein product [Symbiodinium sp. CCMP2456]|nr:unnamed protein product [Symbiodinium sp. CCMP2456]
MAQCDAEAQVLKMTRARAKAMLMELIGEYSTKSFQSKLGDVLQKEAQEGGVCDESPGRWALAEDCHADIFARYGFKSGNGVERLRPITMISQKFPDLADKVQKLWKLLGLKSSPAELFNEEKPQPEASQDLFIPLKPKKRVLSKTRALAFQAELLGAFSAPAFQKKLAEMSRKHCTHLYHADGRAELDAIVEKTKLEILPLYGYEASSTGLRDMEQDMQQFDNDADIFVNAIAIEEVLFPHCQSGRVPTAEQGPVNRPGPKPSSAFTVAKLLRKQLAAFSSPSFQTGISCLKRSAEVAQACEGYYHLRGRADLALPVQRRILPQFGFEGSRAGVLDMVSHCSQFIMDPEVARLFDDINLKLGMTPRACARFRDTASFSIAGGK